MQYAVACALSLFFGCFPLQASGQGPIDVEPEDLQPGLVADYRSLTDKEATLTRIDAKPAFTLGHSSPHPRLPAGPFEVTWTGLLAIKDQGPLSFHAFLCGEATLEVDGVIVLQGRGERETASIPPKEPLLRGPGLYQIQLHYRALAELPARLQIWWEGPAFAREPLPAWHLKHDKGTVPRALAHERWAERGRDTVGRLGCARCHRGAFPGVDDPPPGPALTDLGRRLTKAWLLDWLAEPTKVRPHARMPNLFAPDRDGFVERWIIAEHLVGSIKEQQPPETQGDHRMGQRTFVSLGCGTCHIPPDPQAAKVPSLGQSSLTDLADRFSAEDLAAFLQNPHGRYPDGRMPRLPVTPDTARGLAAYLLLWSKQAHSASGAIKAPTAEEIDKVARRIGARGVQAAAVALVRDKGCAQCHPGLGQGTPTDVPIASADERRGCLSGKSGPRFHFAEETRKEIKAYLAVAAREKHPSAFAKRQRLVEHLGCVHCHQRDSDRPPPIEAIGSVLGGAWVHYVPFQRTPRLSYPHQKFKRSHLLAVVRDGVTGLRPDLYTYRMPAFGQHADAVVQALAEADGDLPDGIEPPEPRPSDPTLAPLAGPSLVGSQGYSCISCHMWNGRMMSEPDPGAVGTDLTRVAGRLRRDWFDRFLEAPSRVHPGTPMPSIFTKGQPASLASVLNGDAAKQREAMWAYFALGKNAPAPKPPPPLAIELPSNGPLVAQIPIRLLDGKNVESICLLSHDHDLLVYDLGSGAPHSVYVGAEILRNVQGRLRTFNLAGTKAHDFPGGAMRLRSSGEPKALSTHVLHGYDRESDGFSARWRLEFPATTLELVETLRLPRDRKRGLVRELRFNGMSADQELVITAGPAGDLRVVAGQARRQKDELFLSPDSAGTVAVVLRYELPAAKSVPLVKRNVFTDPEPAEGSLERPGYRAIAYPRPKTASGEDRIMPGAVAVHPRDGRVFVASMKTGELFVVRDPTGDGKKARFENYGGGLFQEALSMLAEPDGLYVLHRRNLTRIVDRDGLADRFERVAALPHGIADTYDYAYGLARDKTGAFVLSYAPYANAHLPGAGGAVRLVPGKKPEEVGFGFRNPVGWCAGPDGEIFFTDNQGEWVATNKLCHLSKGRFYGFPNSSQRQHTSKPFGKTAVWVPYGWAKSINGLAHDTTDGKFGPFAGQLFLAELMFGGAIIRAQVEKVNGEYQGACFPFWGKGLVGPLTLAFAPNGALWVGSVTEPGWMAQPDRGALFRIDFTGQVPFEMQSIHVRPRGFRIVFTKPLAAKALDKTAFQIEHFRYEFTAAYGSPELDRTRLAIERVEVALDGRSVEVFTAPLVKDRVYMIQAAGVRSAGGESLVHPVGAYTLHEIPAK